MESKWVAIVREEFEEEKGRLDLSRSVFSIGGKGISDTDIPDIIKACQGVENKIIELNLWSNNIGAEGAKYLSAANFFNLTWLNLSYNNIGAEGAKYLSSTNFSNLTRLYLRYNNIQQPNTTYLRLLFEQKNIKNVDL